MTITDRNLKPGTRLTGRYKKADWFATVEAAAGDKRSGSMLVLLDDYAIAQREYPSLSAAGSAIMGGIACNGWRFWSVVEGEKTIKAIATATSTDEALAESARLVNGPAVIKRTPNQVSVPEGETRYHCSVCQRSFLGPADAKPDRCLAGHLTAK